MPFQGENRPAQQKGFKGEQRPEQRGPVADTIFQAITHFPQGAWGSAAQIGGHVPLGPSFLGTSADDLAKLAEVLGAKGARDAVKGVRMKLGPAGMTADEWSRAGNQGVISPALQQDAAMIDILRGKKGPPPQMAPQTTAGRYGASAGDFMGAAAVGPPAGVIPRMVAGGVGGLASEGAGQAVESNPDWKTRTLFPGGPSLPDAARFGAGTLVSAAAGAMMGPNNANRAMGNAMGDTTPAQRTAAVDQMRQAQDQGFWVSPMEAMDYTTKGASRMGRLQQNAENTPIGIELIGPKVAARPEQANAVMAKVLDAIGTEQEPPQLGLDVQRAAQTQLSNTRSGINAQARPFYDQLPGQQLPAQDFAALQANPSYAAAQKAVTSNPELAPLVTAGADDLSTINRVVQQLDEMEANARVSDTNPGGNNTIANQRAQARIMADQLASAASPDWRAARDTVAAGRQSTLEPMQTGPTGALSKTPLAQNQMGALLPERPLPGAPAVTAETVAGLGPPGGDLIRAYLAQQLAESGSRNAKGANPAAPSNFSVKVSGNDIQKENLLAGVGAANPAAVQPLARALQSFDVSGQRLPAGSETVEKLIANEDLTSASSGARAIATGGSLRLIADRLDAALRTLGVDTTREKIAKAVIADPDRAALILEQANDARLSTAQRRVIVAGYIGAQGANTQRTGQ